MKKIKTLLKIVFLILFLSFTFNLFEDRPLSHTLVDVSITIFIMGILDWLYLKIFKKIFISIDETND